MFKEYMSQIYDRHKGEQAMYDTIDIISNMMEKVKETHPHVYEQAMQELEGYLYSVSLAEAKEIVAGMYNEYGMSGERWSYEQIVDVAKQYNLSDSINKCDLYIVMNMWNIDYHHTMEQLGLENNVGAYIMFSCDWLADDDFGEGKVYKYFIKIHEEDREDE